MSIVIFQFSDLQLVTVARELLSLCVLLASDLGCSCTVEN